jgi:hypothetical protein
MKRTAPRPLALFVSLLTLAGCAGHKWAPGPGMSAVDFEPAKARCSLLARHGGSDFAAYGSPNYVAGAALGHALEEAARTQQDFNDCMLASGWQIADGQPTPAQTTASPPGRVVDDPSFQLTNHLQQPIVELYATPIGQPLGGNLLEQGVLIPGATLSAHPSRDYGCNFKLRAVFADKTAKTRTLDLCKTNTLSIPSPTPLFTQASSTSSATAGGRLSPWSGVQ